MTVNFDATGAQECLTDGADGDTGSSLAGAGALDDVANIAVPVFHGAGKVSVPWPGEGDGFYRLVYRRGVHFGLPVLPIAVVYFKRNGRAKRQAVSQTGAQDHLILLDLHAPAAPIAALAARQMDIDVLGGEAQAGWDAFDNSGQPWPVRFPCR